VSLTEHPRRTVPDLEEDEKDERDEKGNESGRVDRDDVVAVLFP
jgi:hypothetical protein